MTKLLQIACLSSGSLTNEFLLPKKSRRNWKRLNKFLNAREKVGKQMIKRSTKFQSMAKKWISRVKNQRTRRRCFPWLIEWLLIFRWKGWIIWWAEHYIKPFRYRFKVGDSFNESGRRMTFKILCMTFKQCKRSVCTTATLTDHGIFGGSTTNGNP